MSTPGILLCLLIVLFLIGQIRVGCKAAYDHEGVQVWVRVAFFHIRVFPLKQKGEKKVQEGKEAKETQKEERKASDYGGGEDRWCFGLCPVPAADTSGCSKVLYS